MQHLRDMETKIELKKAQRAKIINTVSNTQSSHDSILKTEESESFFDDEMLD